MIIIIVMFYRIAFSSLAIVFFFNLIILERIKFEGMYDPTFSYLEEFYFYMSAWLIITRALHRLPLRRTLVANV